MGTPLELGLSGHRDLRKDYFSVVFNESADPYSGSSVREQTEDISATYFSIRRPQDFHEKLKKARC